MSKPLGVSLTMGADGLPCMSVVQSTPVEDAIYRAVEEAIDRGWSPEMFRREAATAWEYRLEQDKRDVRRQMGL